MKKNLLLLTFMLLLFNAFSQDLLSKKGEAILPQKGDFVISIDASPFLNYAGNFIGGNGLNTSPKFDFLSQDQVILGKYFITEKTAFRFGVLLGFDSNSLATKVVRSPVSTPPIFVDNVIKPVRSNVGLTVGMEFRKGKTRLQGYYGAEAGIDFRSASITRTYGNSISAANQEFQTPTEKDGSTFGLGLRSFLGAEYFIFPKISIGGEFGWGLTFSTTGEGEITTNSWNGTGVTINTTKTGNSSSLGVGSDNLNSIFGSAGTIRLNLHF